MDLYPYNRFVLVNQDFTDGRALASLSTDSRLLLASIARMNDDGHAIFDDGELKEILGKIDTETGVKTPLSRVSVYSAKRKLADAGLLWELSGGERCVWLSGEFACRKKSGALCPVHSNAARFYRRRPVARAA
jgi:hypothetical protein